MESFITGCEKSFNIIYKGHTFRIIKQYVFFDCDSHKVSDDLFEKVSKYYYEHRNKKIDLIYDHLKKQERSKKLYKILE